MLSVQIIISTEKILFMKSVQSAGILVIVSLIAGILMFDEVSAQLNAANLTFMSELMESESSPAYLQSGFDRLEQERRAMLILLGWGAANIIAGGTLAAKEPYRDFGLMTSGWGLVNAGIAGFALLGGDVYTASTSYETVLRDEQLFNRILAINTGLNAGYMGVGFTMNYLGSTSRTRQFGTAVMAQGAFLMAFDLWLLTSSTSRLGELAAIPLTLQVNLPDGSAGLIHGLSLSLTF